MRFKARRQVRYVKRKRHSSSRVKHHLKGKHKIYHTIKGKRVSGIYHKGRFYSRRHHLKKGHKIHHTIRHKGVDWHAVSSKIASSVGSAWNYVKKKRNDWKESRARKKYYKENLSAAEREQVKKDLERKNYDNYDRQVKEIHRGKTSKDYEYVLKDNGDSYSSEPNPDYKKNVD